MVVVAWKRCATARILPGKVQLVPMSVRATKLSQEHGQPHHRRRLRHRPGPGLDLWLLPHFAALSATPHAITLLFNRLGGAKGLLCTTVVEQSSQVQT